jgi:SNF2 family DNA or RNA helicase
MGLGKTIQSIALLSFSLQYNKKKKKNLIICPLGLIGNWR